MGQTSKGAKRAAATAKRLYGSDFHERIGAKGGKISKGGFYNRPDAAREAGKKGGKAKKGFRKLT